MSIQKDFLKFRHKVKSFILQNKFRAFKKLYYKENYTQTKRLILFFVPDGTDRINGGILSICTINAGVRELKHVHNCDVVASFLPHKSETDYKYRNFQNDMIIYTFEEIVSYFKNLDFLEVHIPDVMVPMFNKENAKLQSFFTWIEKIPEVKANILNQNDLFMPDFETIAKLKKVFQNCTMTVAHQQYATLEKRQQYDMPLHLLSPWLNPTPYVKRTYSEKENLIIYSPDKIQSIPNGSQISKKTIITSLQKKLPHYKFVEIKNMKYDVYKDHASRAKFAITFGEGLDGYFTETIFSGGVSFAVYNEIFFTKDFKNLPGLYASFDEMNEKIAEDINRLDNATNYENQHRIQDNIVSKMYSFDKLKKTIEQYYRNEFDFK